MADAPLELRRGSSVFMDGTGDYHLRRRGKPGIVATLILPFAVADELTAALDTTLAEVWEDGYEAGNKDVRAVNALWPATTPNPYAPEFRSEQEQS